MGSDIRAGDVLILCLELARAGFGPAPLWLSRPVMEIPLWISAARRLPQPKN